MKKLLLLSIAVMIIGTAKAMDNSVIVSTLVLPPSQGTTIPRVLKTRLDQTVPP